MNYNLAIQIHRPVAGRIQHQRSVIPHIIIISQRRIPPTATLVSVIGFNIQLIPCFQQAHYDIVRFLSVAEVEDASERATAIGSEPTGEGQAVIADSKLADAQELTLTAGQMELAVDDSSSVLQFCIEHWRSLRQIRHQRAGDGAVGERIVDLETV